MVVFFLPCVLCHPRSPGRMLQAAACASLESSVPRWSAALCQRTPHACASRTGPWSGSEANKLWKNFFRHVCFLNWRLIDFKLQSPCVRVRLYQKTVSNGHAYLAIRPPTNPASTCRDALVSVAQLILNGENNGTVIGDPESSNGLLFQSPLNIWKTNGECYAEDPKLSFDECSNLKGFYGIKRTDFFSRGELRRDQEYVRVDANLLFFS